MRAEQDFKRFISSSKNQLGFVFKLTKSFLRTEHQESTFTKYLADSAQAIVMHKPSWEQESKRKIKSYAIFGAMARLIKGTLVQKYV